MNISIVIPVYNEVSDLSACLQAIAEQTAPPFEVIVVDNNSTDGTAALAGLYSFVTVVHEPRQGVIYARTTGFDAARGDIIARIDADTIVPSDWLENVAAVFADDDVAAVSGIALYNNVSAANVFNAIDLFYRRRLSRQLKNRVYLWGANMAMRKRAWQLVRPHLCATAGIHEDYDIAIHLQEIGGVVRFDERLRAQVSSRRIDVPYLDFLRYVHVAPKTYAKHRIRSRWHMYSLVALCAAGYVPARILHRGFDPVQEKFSLAYLLRYQTGVQPRVDPTAHVAQAGLDT